MDQHVHHGHAGAGDMAARRPPLSSVHEAALRSVQKPPAKPWRAGGLLPAPVPPKVYRVEPREFRDLVQRLTGPAPALPDHHHHHVVAAAAAQPVRAARGGGGGEEMYSPWCSFPLLGPASTVDAHHGI